MSNLAKIYTEAFANWLSGGSLINRDKISSIGIKTAYDRVLTKQFIRKTWCISFIPVFTPYNITELIRKEMFKECPEVETMVYMYNTPVTVPVNTELYRRNMARAAQRYEDLQDYYESLRSDEKVAGKTVRIGTSRIRIGKSQLEQAEAENDSFMYVYQKQNGGGQFYYVHMFVECLAPNRKSIKEYRKRLVGLFHQLGCKYKEVKGNVSVYLEEYGLAGYQSHGKSAKFPAMLMSDDCLARCTSYRTRGFIGDAKGILLGMDVRTKLPFPVNFFNSSAGQVILMLGKTGSGKSYAAFQACISLIASKVHCSAIDIKGNEWTKLAKYVQTREIAMEGPHAKFVNTLRLDDIECDTVEMARQFYNDAVRGTVSLFSIMVNLQEKEGNIMDLKQVLQQAVLKLYKQNDVTPENPYTFKNSSNLEYSMILPILKELSTSSSYSENIRQLIKIIVSRCSIFIQGDGIYSNVFTNELTIKDIMDTPLIVYSFNKNSNEMLDTLDTLRVFMVQYLDTKKQSLRKKEKKHTAAFYEELQRSDQFGNLVDYISHSVTGSRSNNVMVFLLLNALSSFGTQKMKPIKSNITTVIAGKLNDEDINTLCDDYNCATMRRNLEHIRDGGNFEHCFAIKYDTGAERDKTIYKVLFPEEMAESLRTRDIKRD